VDLKAELKNKPNPMSKIIYHPANSRGSADHGWLKAKHTFSFASYYNPERIHFGMLRVLNDDLIAAGVGFPTHPHDNMEIITIPLKGAIAHKDSMGNSSVIHKGEIQVMSAGTGIQHSEYNYSDSETLQLLQIWIFPNKKNVEPRYQQLSVNQEITNQLHQILSPHPEDDGVWIHQNAWFHIGKFNTAHTIDYTIKKEGNGVYVFVIDGSVRIENHELSERDGLGISKTNQFSIEILNEETEILLMEIPMN
jgi:redox-sensitive bicupin YhaK (pirin superfamily)